MTVTTMSTQLKPCMGAHELTLKPTSRTVHLRM